MDKLDLMEGMKILSSCYHKEITNDDFVIWYEMLQDVDDKIFRKSIIDICKEKSFMPTIHDILDKTKVINNNYYLKILTDMKKDGYFKEGVIPLSVEQEERNYEKATKWVEKGIIPEFLKIDIENYINKISNKLNNQDRKMIE